nr:MAG TPA: hypothetical protein [Caudoviricetes sp.]
MRFAACEKPVYGNSLNLAHTGVNAPFSVALSAVF